MKAKSVSEWVASAFSSSRQPAARPPPPTKRRHTAAVGSASSSRFPRGRTTCSGTRDTPGEWLRYWHCCNVSYKLLQWLCRAETKNVFRGVWNIVLLPLSASYSTTAFWPHLPTFFLGWSRGTQEKGCWCSAMAGVCIQWGIHSNADQTSHRLFFIFQRSSCPIILLSGPTGCGKTATVHTLAHTMGYTVVEWSNAVDITPRGWWW